MALPTNAYGQPMSLQEHVVEATKSAVAEWYVEQEAEFKQAREQDRKARKGVRKDRKWTESYPIKVTHKTTPSQRSATVTMDGCNRKFIVSQAAGRPMAEQVWSNSRSRWTFTKATKKPPAWNLVVDDPGVVAEQIETSENFESLVQKALVLMLGHAYVQAGL